MYALINQYKFSTCSMIASKRSAHEGPAYFIQMPIVEQLRSSFGLGSL